MVQKERRRGRPRSYDPDAALARALETFWLAGYAATSLDELSAATGMNRPSLYGAFGDKRALYAKALDGYRATARAGMREALSPDLPLADALRRVYERALAYYMPAKGPARGCFMIGTALTEAALDADVRRNLAAGLREIDDAFEARIRLAQSKGEIAAGADPAALAKLASSILYYLAIRSRAGEPRAALQAVADSGVAMICGASPSPDRSRDPGRGRRRGGAKAPRAR